MKSIKKWAMGLLLAALSLSAAAQCVPFVNRNTGYGITDSAGGLYINEEGQKASYFASLGNNTPAATPTDVAILFGSATKTVKVTHVRITVGATSSGAAEYRLVLRSGGTQSAVNTAFANATHSGTFDSNCAASTVIANGLSGVYTSNPASLGTVVGIVDDWTTTILANAGVMFEYTCTRPALCITLRGATQALAINGNAHTLLTGEKVGVVFEYTEE